MKDDRNRPLWLRIARAMERVGPARARAMLDRLMTARTDDEAKQIMREEIERHREEQRCPR